MPSITICITSRDRKDNLSRALESCLAQDYRPLEVLVYDDASNDGTANLVRQRFPEVRLTAESRRQGYIALRNKGLRESTGTHVISIDDDAYFSSPRCVSQAAEAVATWPDCGAFALRYMEPFPIGRNVNGCRITHGDRVRGFVGTANMVNRQAVLALEGFREFFMHQGEERDLCARMYKRDVPIRYAACDPIVHRVSSMRDFDRMHKYGTRNGVLFDMFHVPLLLLPVVLARYVFKASLYRFSLVRMFSVFAYSLWGVISFPRYWRYRDPLSMGQYRDYLNLPNHGPEYLQEADLPAPCVIR